MNTIRHSVGRRICICTYAVRIPLVLTILSFPALAQTPAHRQFQVSLPDFKLGPRDGIAEFKCDIRSAIIEQVGNLPDGWTFEVTNDQSDMARIRAQALVGAAFLRDSSYFKKFMIIEMDYLPNSSAGPPFSIDFRIGITTDPDDTTMREQHFSTHEVVLAPLDEAQSR
jgi:hypothetical protein